MSRDFLRQLFDDGRVRFVDRGGRSQADRQADEARLREADRLTRDSLAGDAPPLDVRLAMEATERFEQLCRVLVDAEAAERGLPPGWSAAGRNAAADYSVDLTYRYLRDLSRLAAGAKNETLAEAIRDEAIRWPLSAVGIDVGRDAEGGATADDPLTSFWGVPSLRMLYCDRVIAAADEDRAREPRVAAELRRLLGPDSPVCRTLLVSTPSPAIASARPPTSP